MFKVSSLIGWRLDIDEGWTAITMSLSSYSSAHQPPLFYMNKGVVPGTKTKKGSLKGSPMWTAEEVF
jgi:hypothetical protein